MLALAKPVPTVVAQTQMVARESCSSDLLPHQRAEGPAGLARVVPGHVDQAAVPPLWSDGHRRCRAIVLVGPKRVHLFDLVRDERLGEFDCIHMTTETVNPLSSMEPRLGRMFHC